MNDKTKSYDVIVVGGGVIGLLSAVALAQLNFTVAVIERNPFKPLCLDETDARVFALNHATINVFKQLGLWQACVLNRVSPYTRMDVFDAQTQGVISFDSQVRLEDTLGYIVEQKVLLNALLQAISHAPNIHLIESQEIQHLDSQAGHVILQDQRVLSASFILGADGAQSWVRKQTPITMSTQSYEQKAIVATFLCEKPHDQTARQYFHPTGPVALLPLKDSNQISLVWSADNEVSDQLMSLDSETFLQQLEGCVSHVLGKMTLLSERRTFPLRKQLANQYVYQKVILLGDAAHVIHPLAGQGMNLGIMDVAMLFDTLKQWQEEGRVLEQRLLKRFQRHRRAHAKALTMAMDAFYHGFRSRNIDLITLRNWGLSKVHNIGIIKNIIVDVALGRLGYSITSLGRDLDECKSVERYGETNPILQ